MTEIPIEQRQEWQQLAELWKANKDTTYSYVGVACRNFPLLLDAYEQQIEEIARLFDENKLLTAGAEKLEELVEQFKCGEVAYETGHEIDEKPVGDLFRIGYAWGAYYDQVMQIKRQRGLLQQAREVVEAVEWVGGKCPWCHGGKFAYTISQRDTTWTYANLHASNCKRQAFLAALQAEEERER